MRPFVSVPSWNFKIYFSYDLSNLEEYSYVQMKARIESYLLKCIPILSAIFTCYSWSLNFSWRVAIWRLLTSLDHDQDH